MADPTSPKIKTSGSGFFAKLTKNIQTYSHLLFPHEKERHTEIPERRTSRVFKTITSENNLASNPNQTDVENALALNIDQISVDEISGSTRVILNAEFSSDEEFEETPSQQKAEEEVTSGLARLNLSSKTISSPKKSNVDLPPENLPVEMSYTTKPSNRKIRHYKYIPLEPQIDEILSRGQEDIYRNVVKGNYKSPVHHLNVHFKLLREDFIAPLREGIHEMRREFTEYGELHQNQYITLYPKCRFICMAARKKVVGYDFCFDVDLKMKNNQWKTTRSLFNGTLLAFSCDNFKTFFFGFVVFTDFHEMLYRRVITVDLCNGRHLEFNEFSPSYAMIEPSSFFAPYLYVMKTLQTFSNENFPFANYVIHANRHIKAPVYFNKHSSILDAYDLSANVQEELGLNTIQFEAYKAALTREFAIIQGPPGTGKTYVALRIVEGFLKNKELARYMSGPILIVCYTNHALDQFVEGVLKYTQNVCRLGYSRNNNKVKPYNYLQMIETFYAISDAIKSVKKGGKKQKAMAQIEDFDSIFSPDKHGKYTMRVRSFKTETYEQRTYDAQLMKAYFFMFIKSPFNIPSSFPKKGILKSCHGCEDHIERISYKINLVNSLSGIVNAKYLEQFMDDVSQFVFKTPGALEAWLTNGNFQLSLSQLRKEQIARNQMSSTSESEDEYDYESSSSSQNSMDRCEEVFYTLDVGQIENEIELSMELLRDMQNEQSRNRFVVNSAEIELQNKVERLQTLCQLVKGSLYALSHGNVNLKEIESTIIKNISSSHDLTSMNMGHRWELYWYWLESYRRLLYTQMKSVGIRYKRLSRQFEESIRNPELLSILKTKDVIAMTTTKAAKIHSVLCELKPKIVVIEEAAEVLETHILASLSKHSEHVVLIGDHKQLRPRTCIYELARDFYFDVSLFERMINNDLPHVTLQVQHRMRPEICELLTPNIYDTLINHPSVTKLPNVKGMPMNVQFFDHKVHEGRHLHETSTWNAFEVNILLNLSSYLLKQGYRCRDITIISAYSGQVELFEETISTRFTHLTDIRVTTIDAYQGEENKIILLSLVRSNVHNNVGFLKTVNRVCVALSRAKQGLYIMGNMKCLSADSQLWQEIKNKLVTRRSINESFRLQCNKHRAVTIIRAVEDFEACCCLTV